MSKIRFTKEQIEVLQRNEHVAKCSEKAITYSKEFKRKAVKQYQEEGMMAKEIFRQAGFDLNVISQKKPKQCLERWNKVYGAKGYAGLAKESRGGGSGRPKIKGLSDQDKIKRLETQVAYLKAENDFLAKLRAKRRE